MITNEFKIEDSIYKCNEYVCERTGIKLHHRHIPRYVYINRYELIDGDLIIEVPEESFEIIKKLLV